jgi:hypothetical protein
MKTFTASRLFPPNILFPPQVVFNEPMIIVDFHDGNKQSIHLLEIRELSVDKLGLGFRIFHIRDSKKTCSIKGIRENQIDRITAAINTYQISTVINWGDRKSILNILRSLTTVLRDLKNPKKYEWPLVDALANKIDEGLKLLKALEAENKAGIVLIEG